MAHFLEELSQGKILSEIKQLLGGICQTYGNLSLRSFNFQDNNFNKFNIFHLFQLGGIATDNDYGSVVMNVEANDPDLDSKLEYSVIGNILPSDKSENLENIEAPPFLLDKNSGDILLNFDPQKGMKGYFAFHVSGAKYLFFSPLIPSNEKKHIGISFAQFVYFWREVCLLFNF